MGALADLLRRLRRGAARPDDLARWETAAREAAEAVPGVTAADATYRVAGGMGEQRTLLVRVSTRVTSTRDLEPVIDAVEAAVAPHLAGFPVRHAALRVVARGLPAQEAGQTPPAGLPASEAEKTPSASGHPASEEKGTPSVARSVLLDELAERNETRGG